MYFNKFLHPANFEYLAKFAPSRPLPLGRERVRFDIESYRDGLVKIAVSGTPWPKRYSQAKLTPPARLPFGQDAALAIDQAFGLSFAATGADGRDATLATPSGGAFGLCGTASIFLFKKEEGDRFYGMGEKWLKSLELGGVRTKFWNTDAYADFDGHCCRHGHIDPVYANIPYLILERRGAYVGLLLDNPHAAFAYTTDEPARAGADAGAPCFALGSANGQSDLWLIPGPTVADVTRKLQKLVGVTPRPPAWALGYHQCRWGYRNDQDLLELDRQFRRHGIPADGLWLDIDYMDAYKVFTFKAEHFPNLDETLADLLKKGRRVVPIVDPGVKAQPGYAVYDDGQKAGVFCRNAAGGDYIGMVWPGETVFPDFSTRKGRAWWTKQFKAFAAHGLHGCWLDMNDPSTGWADPEGMLFNNGRDPHDAYHNQYALGMAEASRAGFLAAHPDRRPFMICRSGCLGSSRHTAIWTGDNASNYHQLRTGIRCTLGLALSGIPMNAPDIGGFDGDTWKELLNDWMRACFLFPFARNHTSRGTRAQEPWAFDKATLDLQRHYIGLRYRFRPYLYNAWIAQEKTGEAVMRPLFYDFVDADAATVDDQFLVGRDVLQAPVVEERAKSRKVFLPAIPVDPANGAVDGNGDAVPSEKTAWYAAHAAKWVPGGKTVTEKADALRTPLYIREGAILPLAPDRGADNAWRGAEVEFHVFLRPSGAARDGAVAYTFDDGESFDYQRGAESVVDVRARVRGRELALTCTPVKDGYGPAQPRFVVYAPFARVTLNGAEARREPFPWTLAGQPQQAWRITTD